ncbi:winged helix-turn-helix domain-containing protein [Streptomyces sp. NPDC006638]|uniref:winged helix-turn-helix domain-containing protein n=1 Tax=Streptomyces sp. NPDC006638 TaxID=3157183 RepID=UPI0033B8A16F
MLRIHFTGEDLARTTVAAGADPLWEVVLSRFRLQDRITPLVFQPWLRQVRADPVLRTGMRAGSQWLTRLAPLGPYFPDFLTPPEACDGLDAGLEALQSTPRRRLRSELQRLDRHRPLPDWARPLADGDPASLGRLAEALRTYHRAAITPHHRLIQAVVDADRARRARSFLDGGVHGVLADLRPVMRWHPPVLEVDYGVSQDLYLRGRGLRLIPSFFCHRAPVALADPDLTPVLIYPIDQTARWAVAAGADDRPLKALMGSTRTAVLHAVGDGVTTTQLALRLNTSLASASRHAGVLRNAGLVSSQRHGSAVLHSLTGLGTALLDKAGSRER